MRPPPGRQAPEEPTPAANPEGESNLPRIPRKWRDDAIRVLRDDGYAVSGDHAWHLLKRWQAWKRDDAQQFIAREFLEFCKRGDLIQIRGKRSQPWRVAS